MNQVTSHGHSVSTRRPVELTQAQSKELKQDAKYQRMTETLKELPKGSAKYKETWAKRRAFLERLRKAKLDHIRKEWSVNQGVEDMERQFLGEKSTEATENSRPIRPCHPAQQRMLDALTATLVDNADAQINRNLDALAANRAYCKLEEPRKTKIQQRQALAASQSKQSKQDDTTNSSQQMREEMRDSTLVHKVGKVLRCYICVAKAEALGVDDPNYNEYCKEFSSPHTLARHFIPAHLDAYEEDDAFECPVCEVTLVNKKHLQNHTQVMHGINTNIKFKRPVQRRQYH